MIRTRLLLPSAAAAALLLAGCSSAPAPDPEPAPASSTPSAAPEPEPVTLRVEADAIVVLDGDTERTRLDFSTPFSESQAILTEVLGGEPEVGELDGLLSPTSGTGYTWPGLLVSDVDGGPEEGIPYDWWVLVDAPVSGDVAIKSLGGLEVGDPAESIAAAVPDAEPSRGGGAFLDSAPTGSEDPMTATAIRVWVLVEDDTISEFRAPSPNCCGD